MKCEDCLGTLHKTLNKEFGHDKARLWVEMNRAIGGIPDAVTIPYKAWPMCLNHYIEWKA